MIQRRFFLGALAGVYIASAGAETLTQFDVVPVWNGRYKTSKPTEVQVNLIAQQGGDFAISTETLSASVKMEADTPYMTWLPLRPDSSSLSHLQSYNRLNPGATVARSVSFIPVDGPHIAIVRDGLSAAEHPIIAERVRFSDHDVLTSVNAKLMPRFAASYDSVDAIVMHFAGLKSLQDRQIQALSDYLMRCGSMVAVAFPDSIFNQLKKVSGCQGKFLISVGSLYQNSEPIPLSLTEKSGLLPALAQFQIAEHKLNIDQPYAWVVIFGLGYFVAGFIAFGIAGRSRILFILPLISTMVVLLVWGQRQPEKVLTSWLEMNAGDASARYSACLTLNGAGIWHERLELPVEAIITSNTSSDGQAQLAGNGYIVSPVKHALLSEIAAYWQSALPLESPLSLAIENKLPMITNVTGIPTKQGLLRWQDGIHVLPALQPGQRWIFNSAVDKADHSELPQLFAKQSKMDKAALLIPYTPDILPFRAKQRGWLLLHGAVNGAL